MNANASLTAVDALAAVGPITNEDIARPIPSIRPVLPTVEPLSQRLATQAKLDQAEEKRRQSLLPRVPLTYYLTTADQIYPEPPPSWANTQNFLVLGTDKRNGEPSWRTDVLMIVGLDNDAGRAAILSIPRDLYIEIPGTKPNRINTVDYLGEEILPVEGGGPALVSQVLQKNFGIKTDHWIRIEMDGLGALVDALGGVTVTLDCPFFEPILNLDTNQWEYFTLPAGDVLMDGETARWFVRLRLRESDIGRARRQRQFLGALQEQAISTNLLLRLPDLWSAMSNLYETDLGLFETMNLARIALSFSAGEIRSGGLSGVNGALENYKTEQGAQVLRLKDGTAVRNIIENVWHGDSVVSTTSSVTTSCPPVPLGPPANPYATPPVDPTLVEPTAPTETDSK